jgi:hypothetical protein
MYCTNCGFAIPAEAGFCAGCGSPVAARPAYQVAVPIAQSGFGPPPTTPPAPYGQHAQQYGSATATGPQPHQAAAPPYPGGYATSYPGQYGPMVPGRYPAAPTGPAADFGPRTVTHWLLPVGRSWQSLVAGYLALFAIILWPLGPFALGLGVWALVRSVREKAHGTGRAVFAVIVGLLATFLLVAVLLPH